MKNINLQSWYHRPVASFPLKCFNQVMLHGNKLIFGMLNWKACIEQLKIELVPNILTKKKDDRLVMVPIGPLEWSTEQQESDEYLIAFKNTLNNIFSKFDKVKNVSIMIKLNTKYSNVEIVESTSEKSHDNISDTNDSKDNSSMTQDFQDENNDDHFNEFEIDSFLSGGTHVHASIVLRREDFTRTVDEYIDVYIDEISSTVTMEKIETLKQNGFNIRLNFMFGNLTSINDDYHDNMAQQYYGVIDAQEYVAKHRL